MTGYILRIHFVLVAFDNDLIKQGIAFFNFVITFVYTPGIRSILVHIVFDFSVTMFVCLCVCV